jgi:hypothetical protein
MIRPLASASIVLGLFAAAAPSALADRLTLADGRVVEGAVSKDGETYRVASRFGEAEFAAKDVKEWVKAETIEGEWRRRAAALKDDDFAGRAALSKWLTEAGRVEEGAALAQSVTEVDPENAVAHAVLGHVRHRGSWMSPDAARAADGLVRHGDAWYTPEEWALVGKEAQAKALESDRAAASKQWNVRVNEAVRLMLAPDERLRAEGEKRLLAVATESNSKPLEALAAQVKDYAASTDRLVAAAMAADGGAGGGGGGGGIGDHATVMAECRIQLAKLKRPIQSFTTGLGGSAAGSSVTLQLPELEVIRIGTTVGIPVR